MSTVFLFQRFLNGTGNGDMTARELKRLKELEEENRKLKQMYARLALDYELAGEIIERSG